jgi:hypothetical protein
MPLAKGDIVVTNVSPTATFDSTGQAVRMTNVEFTVRGKGPFSRQIPTEQFRASEIISMINDYAAEIVTALEHTG